MASERERSSTTKSGHKGGNSSCSSAASASHRDRGTQARSGERLAPLGSVKPVDESKPRPVPSASTHRLNSPMRVKLRDPVHPPVGGIMTRSPLLVRSIRHSGFNWHKTKNSWSLIFSTREPRCRMSGWDAVTMAAGLMPSPPFWCVRAPVWRHLSATQTAMRICCLVLFCPVQNDSPNDFSGRSRTLALTCCRKLERGTSVATVLVVKGALYPCGLARTRRQRPMTLPLTDVSAAGPAVCAAPRDAGGAVVGALPSRHADALVVCLAHLGVCPSPCPPVSTGRPSVPRGARPPRNGAPPVASCWSAPWSCRVGGVPSPLAPSLYAANTPRLSSTTSPTH